MSVRIGITQRIVQASTYLEPRDALAQDWAHYMNAALPDVPWLPLPNLGSDIVQFARSWNLTGLILSGGETPGEAPLRDKTESMLIEFARDYDLPILGVCRGLQMLAVHNGCGLAVCDPDRHAATRHKLQITHHDAAMPSVVNSFHTMTIIPPLPASWNILAVEQNDRTIEAISADGGRTVGIMWHPERESTPSNDDIMLFRRHFLPTNQ
ncbi:gamma-glutamyl-gamma-aminobutyrate hydrolase family protein [Thalassobaculum sp.]|uniref:gamma-glutamyl-gamma-aminobutyrate hydrolase family protein n=1 Tax=Thalassobaculum sp. TaxID=2022740 RepID=UPI0032EE29EF